MCLNIEQKCIINKSKCFAWQHFVWSVWTTWQPHQTWCQQVVNMIGSSNTDFWCTGNIQFASLVVVPCFVWHQNVLFEDVLIDSCALWTLSKVFDKSEQNILNVRLTFNFTADAPWRYLHKSKRFVWRRSWSVWSQPYWICYVGFYNFVRHNFTKLHYFKVFFGEDWGTFRWYKKILCTKFSIVKSICIIWTLIRRHVNVAAYG